MVAFTSILATLAVAGAAAAAPALEPRAQINGRLHSALRGDLCVGLSGTSDGSKLMLKSCWDESTSVSFNDGDGLLWFNQAGRVADIPWGNYYDGQNPQLWASGPNDNQRWYRHSPASQRNGDGVSQWEWQQIKTQNGGNFCLDVHEGRAEPGAQIQIWSCAGGDSRNQAFYFA
ncbi:uncharacterized protein COLE_06683 [Cutaneotrichosporon oleaginosum]|uniref:uncharacterized protein n=1 Tax=Cutaneotrichosporon oleaginosum TaxID=879819 RepID=UPI00132309FD|nr:hypothetical protein COLE_06683 [Cutaneotrichosporon oleaginosum]